MTTDDPTERQARKIKYDDLYAHFGSFPADPAQYDPQQWRSSGHSPLDTIVHNFARRLRRHGITDVAQEIEGPYTPIAIGGSPAKRPSKG